LGNTTMPHSKHHHKHEAPKPSTSGPFEEEVTPESVKNTPLISGDASLVKPDAADPSRSSLKLNKEDYTPTGDDDGTGSTDETRPTDPEYPMQNQVTSPQNKR